MAVGGVEPATVDMFVGNTVVPFTVDAVDVGPSGFTAESDFSKFAIMNGPPPPLPFVLPTGGGPP